MQAPEPTSKTASPVPGAPGKGATAAGAAPVPSRASAGARLGMPTLAVTFGGSSRATTRAAEAG
jgi:hypothetical protein